LSVTRNGESASGLVDRRRAGSELRVLESGHVGWFLKSNNGRGIEMDLE
jgi:hypothetical protein